MNAKLVWDGVELFVPSEMGTPKEGQLVGTPLEQLGEVACRICYDSLGIGRPSNQLHKHILEVDNSSVYEHCTFTVLFFIEKDISQFLRNFLNRKGVYVELNNEKLVKVTFNFRAVLEWAKYSNNTNRGAYDTWLERCLYGFGYELAPQIFEPIVHEPLWTDHQAELLAVDELLSDDQIWISMWVRGSRGFSHELVRHRFAMSQRSTRYVDESESEYVIHPLINQYHEIHCKQDSYPASIEQTMYVAQKLDRVCYKLIVQKLENWLIERGLPNTDARKQARGAARGNLGNALETQLIFSAPISGWKWMLQKRASKFADAEIRSVFCDVLSCLKESRWGSRFNDYNLEPSPDGLGFTLRVNGIES